MPATYPELLLEVIPEVIESDEQYETVMQRFSALFKKKNLTRDETKLKKLLGVLIQDYDRRQAFPEDKSTPAELLQFLVEQSGKAAAELLQPVFGSVERVNSAVNGNRPISADEARALGKLFCVKPGIFI